MEFFQICGLLYKTCKNKETQNIEEIEEDIENTIYILHIIKKVLLFSYFFYHIAQAIAILGCIFFNFKPSLDFIAYYVILNLVTQVIIILAGITFVMIGEGIIIMLLGKLDKAKKIKSTNKN
jgi:hypothetical protein